MLGLLPWWILTLMLSYINAENDANQKRTTYLNTHFLEKNTTEVITIEPKLTNRHSSNHSYHRLVTLPPRPPGHYYQNSRWGPFFEEGSDPFNITVRVGTTVRMNCKIGLLHDKTVTWVHRKGDTIHLLTVARQPYSTDQRITLSFRYPNNWRLQITSVTKRDDGLYECQVATHPPTIKRVYLKVTAPEVKIIDEQGNPIVDRYYKADSQVDLCCFAVEIQPSLDTLTWWKANTLLVKGVTTVVNASTSTAVSNLTITSAQRRHSGNYTCSVGQLTAASVFVHILNGDLTAAVHDGSSGTIASCFIATWLLTLCCLIGTDCILCR